MEYWPIIIAAFLLWGILKIIRPSLKGALGENAVSIVLRQLCKQDYKIIHNVTLFNNGYKTQIDHIIVSSYGVFVIETKNFKGWILGGEHSKYWTQVIYKRRHKMYNPILQNYGHVKSLRFHLSDYPNLKYIPIVVFTRRSTLKVTTSSPVIYTHELVRTVQSYKEKTINESLMDEIYQRIQLKNRAVRNRLIKKSRKRKRKLDKEFCPSCFGTLILKNGKFGSFKGCSNFPTCRYTSPIDKRDQKPRIPFW